MSNFPDKYTLAEVSTEGPALACLGAMYIAWKGDGNDHLNLRASTDFGRTWGTKYTSPENSPHAPALCVHNNFLYIAWKGDGNDNLNVAQVQAGGTNITGFSNKVVLGEQSPEPPALVSFDGKLILAWKGDGNDNLNLICSTDDGRTFGNKYVSAEHSPKAPALCMHNNQLYIAWKGDGNDNLNVASVVFQGATITGFANKVVLANNHRRRLPSPPSTANSGSPGAATATTISTPSTRPITAAPSPESLSRPISAPTPQPCAL